MVLYKRYGHCLAFVSHLFGPNARLDLSDVCLLEEEHTEARLTNTSSNTQGESIVQDALMEI
jgi:hypothetical protein